VRRRYRKGLDNFFSLYRPLAETWTIFDTSAAGHPIIVAEGTCRGDDIHHDEQRWTLLNG
jgi:predicted ABC-type ATPase